MSASTPSPLRVLFLTTSMPVGGAETLLLNLVRQLDRDRFAPEIGCLKTPGPLGEMLAAEMPVHSQLLSSKYDLRILPRLAWLMRQRQIDAVVTVGAGDKMFWGRLAAKLAGVPVIMSALHSTGWPDSVGRLNRWLTPLTDAFIGVADAHADHLVTHERFPRDKVHTIYNGIDTDVFAPTADRPLRDELQIAADAPVVGILAALRPEKNHELFLAGAQQIVQRLPDARFVIIGDGDRRHELEALSAELSIAHVTHFLGSRSDVARILPDVDVVALTSHNEASPVSILEAMSCSVPVVSARVGSVGETVLPGETGALFEPGDLAGFVQETMRLLQDPTERNRLGCGGRAHVVKHCSLAAMVDGYESLIWKIYQTKQLANLPLSGSPQAAEKPAQLPKSASPSSL
ncbi:MAG: glycosyltransferase [Bythopirellula sp.]